MSLILELWTFRGVANAILACAKAGQQSSPGVRAYSLGLCNLALRVAARVTGVETGACPPWRILCPMGRRYASRLLN